MSLNLIIDTNDPQQNGLLVSFNNTGIQQDDSEFVRNDKMLAFSIQPVVSSGDPNQPWAADALDSDTYQVAIGNPDLLPASGEFPLTIGAQTVSGIDFNQSAASLQTSLSAAWIAAGYTSVTVVALGPTYGSYEVTATGNGAVPSMTSGTNTLLPFSNVNIVVVRAGSVSTTAQQIVTLRQSPVAYDVPSTLLPVAAVSSTIFQNGDSSHNKIYTVAYTAGSYGGSFAVSVGVPRTTRIGVSSVDNPTEINTVDANGAAQPHGLNTGDSIVISGHTGSTPAVSGTYTATVLTPTTFTVPVNVTVPGYGGLVRTSANVTSTAGISTPAMSANDFSLLLQTNALISASDVSVTRVSNGFNVQFIGLYQLSNAPTLGVTNIDLEAPKGVSGFIDLNTVTLFNAFLLTDSDELTYTFAIRRQRASGEDKEFFQKPTILKRNIIDVTTMVPILFPNYITETQADARYLQLTGGTLSGVLKTNGGIQSSGGNEWVNSSGTIKLTSDGVGIKNENGDVFIDTDGNIQLTPDSIGIKNAAGDFFIGNDGTYYDASSNVILTTSGRITPPGGIRGETSTGSAATGNIGEFISSTVVSGSAVTLSNSVAATITSISLTAGDWEVDYDIYFNINASTIFSIQTAFNSTSATLNTAVGSYTQNDLTGITAGTGILSQSKSISRVSISSTTTIYLIGYAAFSGSGVVSFGQIRARRSANAK